VVIDDFDTGRSFLVPFEAYAISIIDPNAEVAFTAASQRLQPAAAKRPQVFKFLDFHCRFVAHKPQAKPAT
jgi:hypothetical protein